MPAQEGHGPVLQEPLAVTFGGKLSWEETDTRQIIVRSAVRFAGGGAQRKLGLPLGAGQENALEDEQDWYLLSTHVFAR